MAEKPQQAQTLRVQYEEMTAKFASQFVVNMGEDELILNFSSGIISDNANQGLLPIHTRIALSPLGARKLHAILSQVLNQRANGQKVPEQATAKLPEISAQTAEDDKKSN